MASPFITVEPLGSGSDFSPAYAVYPGFPGVCVHPGRRPRARRLAAVERQDRLCVAPALVANGRSRHRRDLADCLKDRLAFPATRIMGAPLNFPTHQPARGFQWRQAVTDTPAALAALIASRVKQRRREARMTLAELSAASGLARATLHGIEQGKARRVTVGTLLRLADALAMPPDALLGRDLSRVPFSDAEQRLVLAHRRIFSREPAP